MGAGHAVAQQLPAGKGREVEKAAPLARVMQRQFAARRAHPAGAAGQHVLAPGQRAAQQDAGAGVVAPVGLLALGLGSPAAGREVQAIQPVHVQAQQPTAAGLFGVQSEREKGV